MAQDPQNSPAKGDEPAKQQFVEYKPTGGRFNFHAREITAKQWRDVGVEEQKTVVWNHGNKFRVSVGDLNANALKLLEDDPELVIVEA